MENLLPVEIQLNIFSRLPAESVLQCKQVCKRWLTLLHNNPYFAHMHLQQSLGHGKKGLLFLCEEDYQSDKTQLYYGECDQNDEQSYNKILKRYNHPPIDALDVVVDSCNGLICFSTSCLGYDDIDDALYYICNPMTREYVNLPRCNTNTLIGGGSLISYCMMHGFGYVPSTNEYKVVRILYCRDQKQTNSSSLVGYVRVYTLGGGSGWRHNGVKLTYQLKRLCVLANGALYWLVDEEMKILVFDLADEEFRILPLPPNFAHPGGPGGPHSFDIQVIGGFLCFVHQKYGICVDIWLLKKNHRRSTTTTTQSWTWHREVSIAWKSLISDDNSVLDFTKSSEVPLWYRNSILSHSDPTKFDSDLEYLEVIPHLNSLVSLKALGEEDVKIIESV